MGTPLDFRPWILILCLLFFFTKKEKYSLHDMFFKALDEPKNYKNFAKHRISEYLKWVYRYDKIDLSRISVQPILNTSSRFASVFVQYLFVRCSETGLAGEVRESVHHNGPLPQLDLLPFFTNRNVLIVKICYIFCVICTLFHFCVILLSTLIIYRRRKKES